MVSDEQLFAWLDGEVGDDEARRIEREVLADARLSDLAAQHRTMQAKLRRAFDPIAESPVPEPMLAGLRQQPAKVVDLDSARRERRPIRWAPVQWAALAATLALGILLGTMVPNRGAAPVEAQGGKIYAAAALDRALDTQLASAPSAAAVRVGMTFRDQSGTVCRTFTDAGTSGLACRDGERWQMRGLFTAPEGQSSDYRMAAGMDPNLGALVDSTIAGEPFGTAQEKAARDRGWR